MLRKTKTRFCLLALLLLLSGIALAQGSDIKIVILGAPDLSKDQMMFCKWVAKAQLLVCYPLKNDTIEL